MMPKRNSHYYKMNRKQRQQAYNEEMARLSAIGEKPHARRHCGGKVPYSKTQARSKAAQLATEKGDPYAYYKCEYCRQWHVGMERSPEEARSGHAHH
jgi:hypothetical protein